MKNEAETGIEEVSATYRHSAEVENIILQTEVESKNREIDKLKEKGSLLNFKAFRNSLEWKQAFQISRVSPL